MTCMVRGAPARTYARTHAHARAYAGRNGRSVRNEAGAVECARPGRARGAGRDDRPAGGAREWAVSRARRGTCGWFALRSAVANGGGHVALTMRLLINRTGRAGARVWSHPIPTRTAGRRSRHRARGRSFGSSKSVVFCDETKPRDVTKPLTYTDPITRRDSMLG